jgi:CubicO group peptidase (beta-lactamase class C family)
MMLKKSFTSLAFLFILFVHAAGQIKKPLPRSVPETEGVSSAAINNFLDAAAKSNNEFHSIMIVRHGKVVAEGWWSPYQPALRHTMYSVSKSFTATAVGFAVSEGKLKVSDKVLSFFPEYKPAEVNEYLEALTVGHLLSMTVGQDPDPTGPVAFTETNWIKGFLATPIKNAPGTKFLYNSLGTYMLSAIVQKVTGQRIVDYLKPRLFDPLGIEGMDWETDPMGINSGGWGLRVRTEDMAKFGQLFLQKGSWQGKQILPAAWVEEATTKKIDQKPDATEEEKSKNDWLQGYCYQMWRCRNNAYRGDGAFGQYIIVMPDQDAVIAITSETGDMQDILNLVWEHLLPAFKPGKLPLDMKLTSQLKQRLSSLKLPAPAAAADSAVNTAARNKTFTLNANDRGFKTISFAFNGNNCDVQINTDTATHKVSFGARSWKPGITNKRGPSLVGGAKNHFAGLGSSKVVGAYRWKNGNTLELLLRYIESPHTETFTCTFDNENVSIEIQNSFEKNRKFPVLKGRAE